MKRPSLFAPRLVRYAVLSYGLLSMPSFAAAQQDLTAIRQTAFETGHGTLALKRVTGGMYYALNRPDRCVWLFSASGTSTGRISSIGMAPSDLLSPKDLAVDPTNNAVIADASGAIKVFSPAGQLLTSIPFKRPEHVAVLSDGRILASGFPRDTLISIFDKQGKLLGGIGTPASVDDNTFFNAVLNLGSIVVDSHDNIYYVFRHMLVPTVRRYRPDGTLTAEWHLQSGEVLNQIVAAAKVRYQENKKSGSYGGVPILTAADFDDESSSLWVASGAQVTQLDASGNILRMVRLMQPDGKPLQVSGIAVYPTLIRASGYMAGVFEYSKPR